MVFRIFIILILLSQIILLYIDSTSSVLSLILKDYFVLTLLVPFIISLMAYRISREKYLLIFLLATLFLPFIGSAPYKLALYIIYFPLLLGGININRLQSFALYLIIAFSAFYIRCSSEFYLIYQTIVHSNFSMNSLYAVLPLIKQPYMLFADVIVIGSLLITLSIKDIDLLKAKLVPLTPIYAFTSLIFIGMQLGQVPLFSINQTEFWTLVKRYSGPASDPNAFGLILGLLSMFFILNTKLRKKSDILTAILLLVLSQFSGSRTFYIFFVASVLKVILFDLKVIKIKKSFLIYIPILLCLSLPLVSKFKVYVPETSSFRRLLDTIDPNSIGDMLASRGTYSKLAFEGIGRNPIMGYGLNGFYEKQAYLDSLAKAGISTWRDNSNNFYLELLLTLGIPISLFIIYQLISTVSKSELETKWILGIVGISLLTGPHIYFIEFSILVFLYLIPLKSQFPLSKSILYILIPCLVVHNYMDEKESFGLYPTESNMTRWIIDSAYIKLCTNSEQIIRVRNLNPAQNITLNAVTEDGGNISLSKTSLAPNELLEFNVNSSFYINSDTTWIPNKVLGTPDYRPVSVQIEWPSLFNNCL